MNDAVILLAISQIVCLAGMAYLYLQVQGMSNRQPRRQAVASQRAQPIERSIPLEAPRTRMVSPVAATVAVPAMANAYASAAAAGAPVVNRMAELGVDVQTLARRMNKSEEEVKLMLRRQAVRQ